MSDVLFLLDQSALVDPVACSSPLNEFGFTLQGLHTSKIQPQAYFQTMINGAKGQKLKLTLLLQRSVKWIVPESYLNLSKSLSRSTAIARLISLLWTLTTGERKLNFIHVSIYEHYSFRNIDNLHCKLYGHDGFPCGENMDDIEFKRRPICGSGGLKNAIIESASYEHQSVRVFFEKKNTLSYSSGENGTLIIPTSRSELQSQRSSL